MTVSAQPILRFAPSPNGRLHLGHAFSAVLNQRLAEHLGGRFLVRLEDIDLQRCTAELAKLCLEDLEWLGLRWEQPVRVQSQHFNDYAKALDSLRQKALLYPCFCTRREIAERSGESDPDGAPLYPGTCRDLPSEEVNRRIQNGKAHAWRLNMDKALKQTSGAMTYTRFELPSLMLEKVAAQPSRWGDVILARKETPTSYHLSVVVDDALQGVTHVVRGKDLESSTCIHVLLQALLELPFPLYHHHRLFNAPTGGKLSKSKGSESLADLRAVGFTPTTILTLFAFSF